MRAVLVRLRSSIQLGRRLLKDRRATQTPLNWRSPEELVGLGFARTRVVMINEAHNGWLRCVRTRAIGLRILPAAHAAGVRHLAMEALWPPFAAEANTTRELPEIGHSYLAQPDMRVLIQAALALGWTLIPYEADTQHEPPTLSHAQSVNWREEQQARNLISALGRLPKDAKLLVWCGNNHHSKRISGNWKPMGYQFQRLSRIEPFVIDQTITVEFEHKRWSQRARLIERFATVLAAHGGTAGVLVEESAEFTCYRGSDAVVLAIENELE